VDLSWFELLDRLGNGSQGAVYLVKKLDENKLYAMKVLGKKTIMNSNMVQFALTERNIMQLMDHPFIVSLKCSF